MSSDDNEIFINDKIVESSVKPAEFTRKIFLNDNVLGETKKVDKISPDKEELKQKGIVAYFLLFIAIVIIIK